MKVIFRALIVMHITPMLYAAQTPAPYAHIAVPIVKRPCSAPPGFMLDSCMCLQCSKPDADEQSQGSRQLNGSPSPSSEGAFRRFKQPEHRVAAQLSSPTDLRQPASDQKSLLPSLPNLKHKGTFSSDKLRSLQAYFAAKDDETKAEQKLEGAGTLEKEPKEQKSGRRGRRKKRGQRKRAAKLQAIRNTLVE